VIELGVPRGSRVLCRR